MRILEATMCIAASVAALWCEPCEATVYMKSGLVAGIYAQDSSSGGGTSFTIAGFGAADVGNECAINDGMVALALRGDEDGKRQLAVLLAAHLAGKQVRVRVDTTKKNASGVCYLWLLERMDY